MKKYNKRLFAGAVAVMMVFSGLGALSCSAAVVSDGTAIYALGDTNRDKAIDIRDFVRIKRFLAGNAELLTAAADVNGDGSVTAEDMTQISKYLLGMDSFAVNSALWSSEIR